MFEKYKTVSVEKALRARIFEKLTFTSDVLNSWIFFFCYTHAWEYPLMMSLLHVCDWPGKYTIYWRMHSFSSLTMSTPLPEFLATKSSLLAAHPDVPSQILWPTSSDWSELLISSASPFVSCWSSVTAAVALEYRAPDRGETIREGRPHKTPFPLRGLFFLQVNGASGGKAIHLYHLIQRTHY